MATPQLNGGDSLDSVLPSPSSLPLLWGNPHAPRGENGDLSSSKR
ncbi:uncharacterized protein J3R85_005160 [Psidium guajava]|nr:uncharacterized protein J3R85_005160 [Psidium guajava]